ncbi:MAG: MFS transporter [Chitinophagaceae bacterium]|jgi:MFS family permease|nr:MFS transporter [Chitinophagaceae bacterium]
MNRSPMPTPRPIQAHRTISACFFLCGFVFATWAARIPSVKDAFRLDEGALGTLLFMLPLGSILALPVAGWVIHRLGSRIVTTISLFLYSGLLVMLSLVDTLPTLSVILFLFGFVGDFLNISMNTQGLTVQHARGKPILSGLHAQWSFGALTGAAFGGWTLRMAWPTQLHFSAVGLISVIPCLVMMRFLLPEPEKEPDRQVFRWPTSALWLLGIICFCNTMAEGAMADWSSLYYRQTLTDTAGVSTTGYVAFTLSMALGRLAGDRIIGWLGYRKTLMSNGLLIAAGLGFALLWPEPAAVITGFSAVGLGVSSVIPIAYMMAGRSRDMAPAAALASVSAIGFTGFLIGPPLIGLIADASSLSWGLALVALLGIGITLFSLRVRSDL